ncbi:MAG: hypothetical protein EXX96DRAFT_608151 [Benjaminiella poitrasii]|nr:MAG: hypothetical protein EXX96DRAFT_608151 [Benjaminiella poitrasii]
MIRKLSCQENIVKLNEHYESSDVLDLTKALIKPKRFADKVKSLKTTYKFDTGSFAGGRRIWHIEAIICNLYYLRLLFNSNSNEVWYKAIVYGVLFGFIFAVQSNYVTKRFEHYSEIVKSLRKVGLFEDEKAVKLDCIFTNTAIARLNDVFL